jgi:metal-dependent amidase/aminoacylase/carboxypeptidase family protein
VRATVHERVERIAGGVARAYGVHTDVRIVRGYPPVVNDASLAESAARYVADHTDARVVAARPTMGGEDFAYFAQRVPGLQIRLGVRGERAGAIHPGHSAEFRIDEDALPVGVETLVAFATGVGAGEIRA